MAQIYAPPPPTRIPSADRLAASPNPRTSSPPPQAVGPGTRQSTQRRLQLRQARFPGLTALDSADADREAGGTGSAGSSRRSSASAGELGILREISNSSLHRRERRKEKGDGENARENEAEDDSGSTKRVQRKFRSSKAGSATGRQRVARRSSAGEQGRYIQHLEAQLVAVQAQVQALMSPSSSGRAQAAKLRAVTSESRLLRREVHEWEDKFETRIKEQVEQYETAVGSLRTQVRTMQKEMDLREERFKELEAESEEKGRQLVALEGSNYDLERRLGMMSELLAMSPSKLTLRTDFGRDDSRRTSYVGSRPLSTGPLRRFSRNSLYSPRDSTLLPPWLASGGESPVSPTWHVSQTSIDSTVFEGTTSASSVAESGDDFQSATSGSTLLSSPYPTQASRLASAGNQEEDGELKRRPLRRMRRFHSGATGPRSLILSKTTSTDGECASVPVPATVTPEFEDDRVESGSNIDETIVGDNSTPIVQRSRQPNPKYEQSLALQSLESGDSSQTPSTKRNDVFEASARNITAKEQRVVSKGNICGENLFEELNRLQEQEDHDEASIPPPHSGEARMTDRRSPPTARSHATLETPSNNPLQDLTSSPHQELRYIPVTGPASLLQNFLTLVSRTLADKQYSAHCIVSNAWSTVVLSRPVLEFRFWLIRILLGDLQKKGKLIRGHNKMAHPSSPQSSQATRDRNISTGTRVGIPQVGLRARQQQHRKHGRLREMEHDNEAEADDESDISDDEVYETFNLQLQSPRSSLLLPQRHGAQQLPVLPPLQWLKFSLGLVFAVGLAIKDGPESLFTRKERREDDEVLIR